MNRFVREINVSDIFSSFAGLVWFDNNYSSITEIAGKVKFDSRDVSAGETVLPNGTHASYKTKRFTTPRARVELNKGVVTVSAGDNCPDNAIKLVIDKMGLKRYVDRIEVRRSSFWDRK